MDIAVVTGASSGLGLAISRRLLDLGFRVYGLGGNYAETTLSNVDFRPLACDLGDPGHVEVRIKEILAKEGAITVLVNNAKYYPPDDFLQAAPAEFARSLNVNLLCPLVLVRWCLDGLRRTRGCVVNISSATPETARGGPIGACAAGGLRWMQEALFQQLRDDGVAISSIYPEPNRWRPEDAPPPNGERPQSAIDPQAVADALVAILNHGRSNVITEVVIRPERLVERTIPPVRELPYPKPKPIPYTVPREQIEAEERAEREEEERELGIGDDNGEKKAARKRRRRGRGRDRDDREQSDGTPSDRRPESRTERGERPQEKTKSADKEPKPGFREQRPEKSTSDSRESRPEKAASASPTPVVSALSGAGQDKAGAPADAAAAESSEGRRRRRKGRKPRPAGISGEPVVRTELRPGPVPTPAALAPVTKEKVAPAPAPKPAPEPAADRRRSPEGQPAWAATEMPQREVEQRRATQPAPAKKEPVESAAGEPVKQAQKTAKKAARKTATKKAATKKSATKKAAVKKTVVKKAARKRAAKKAASGDTPESGAAGE